MGAPDPRIAALAATKRGRAGRTLRVNELFADQPDILDAIRDARRGGASFRTIAEVLSTPEQHICAGAVDEWYRQHG